MYIHVCLFMYVKLEPSFIYLHAYLTDTQLLCSFHVVRFAYLPNPSRDMSTFSAEGSRDSGVKDLVPEPSLNPKP